MGFRLESSPRLKKLSTVNYSPTPWGLVSHLSTCKSPRMPHVSPGWGGGVGVSSDKCISHVLKTLEIASQKNCAVLNNSGLIKPRTKQQMVANSVKRAPDRSHAHVTFQEATELNKFGKLNIIHLISSKFSNRKQSNLTDYDYL